jgi:hypothetical protein
MSNGAIRLIGRLPEVEAADLARIGVFLVQGNNILGQATPTSGGHFAFSLPRATVEKAGASGLEVVVGPIVIRYCWPIPLLELPRVSLATAQLAEAREAISVDLSKIDLSPKVLEIWWRWCREYCVSGTLVGSNNCPVPYASVTVYTVGLAIGGGYTKVARGTVTTDAQGHFTVCFPWCSCEPCWPCWPTWYLCWPWWWERDILAVIDALESRGLTAANTRPGIAGSLTAPPLARPATQDLMLGRGFTAATETLQPDPVRAAQVRRKLSNPAIRAIFPWWWWCCENPNIVFSATQAGNVVLDENPAFSTRWCLPSGSNVTLVANDSALTTCGGGSKPPTGFLWTRVGQTPVNQIGADGYAAGSGDGSDCAFTGALDIYGEFAAGSGVWFYQLEAAQWSGDPARSATAAPGAASAIGPLLTNQAIYLDAANVAHFVTVNMGPFSVGTLNNLYATEENRANVPAAYLPPVPWPAGTIPVWIYSGRKVNVAQPPYAELLIPGSATGAGTVSLSVLAYGPAPAFTPVPLTPNTDDTLTLTIDTTQLSAKINSFNAYTSGGVPVNYDTNATCPSLDVGPGGYVVLNVTVTDAQAHLCQYELVPDFGHGLSGVCVPGLRGYEEPGPYPPSPYQAPNTSTKSFGGGTENIAFYPTVDCCYDFRLNVSKRVTDGTNYPPQNWTADFWTATISID